MIKIGAKVYAYVDDKIYLSTITNQEVIGEIVEITESNWVIVHSIIDDQMYMHKMEDVFEVGTGPGVDKSDIVYEDHYV